MAPPPPPQHTAAETTTGAGHTLTPVAPISSKGSRSVSPRNGIRGGTGSSRDDQATPTLQDKSPSRPKSSVGDSASVSASTAAAAASMTASDRPSVDKKSRPVAESKSPAAALSKKGSATNLITESRSNDATNITEQTTRPSPRPLSRDKLLKDSTNTPQSNTFQPRQLSKTSKRSLTPPESPSSLSLIDDKGHKNKNNTEQEDELDEWEFSKPSQQVHRQSGAVVTRSRSVLESREPENVAEMMKQLAEQNLKRALQEGGGLRRAHTMNVTRSRIF